MKHFYALKNSSFLHTYIVAYEHQTSKFYGYKLAFCDEVSVILRGKWTKNKIPGFSK